MNKGKFNKTKKNKEIFAKEVRVVSHDGEQLGIMSSEEAIRRAEELGLDLVEISPVADPPVCKIMDYGKFQYKKTKKTQEAKKKKTQGQVKEIKLRPRTEQHDLMVKTENIKKFLSKKDKVKVTVVFRGREMSLVDFGRENIEKIIEEIESSKLGAIENPPRFEGKSLVVTLVPS